MKHLTSERLATLATMVSDKRILCADADLEKYSKDYAWFSPILKAELENKQAEAVVLVPDLETLKALVAWCYRETIPVTLRGGGTGNYGQCTPLYGGILLELMSLDAILEIKDGEVRTEPGVRIFHLENEIRKHGYEMRCIPSTWVKSSIAGFLCGGSGGVGSISYGGTANSGMVKQLKILTLEEEPKVLTFNEAECLPALNTYGTTGIVVELTLRLVPKFDYDQHILVHDDFDFLFKWSERFANDDRFHKRLLSIFEAPISATFKPLLKHYAPEKHSLFIMVDREMSATLLEEARAAGLEDVYFLAATNPLKPPFIIDYTWNHTMLWFLKEYPDWTYLQVDYGENVLEKCHLLSARYPGELFHKFEWVKATSKWKAEANQAVPGGGPRFRYKGEAHLQEMIAYIESIGCSVTSPHVCKLEEGYYEEYVSPKTELKRTTDPKGILNPGKMTAYDRNPFEPAGV